MTEKRNSRAAYEKRKRMILTTIYSGIVLIGIGTFVLLDQTFLKRSIVEQRSAFQNSLELIKFRLNQRLEAYSSMSYSLAASLSFGPLDDPDKFQTLAQLMRDNNAGVINIARAEDYVVTDVHPIKENRGVLGFDYRKSPTQLSGVQRAIDSKSTIVVGPINLVQGGLGLLLRTAQKGNANIVYSIVLDLESFFEEIGLVSKTEAVITSVRKTNDDVSAGRAIFGPEVVWASNPVTVSVALGKRNIEIGLIPVGGWKVDTSYRLVLALVIVAIGLLATHGVNYARQLIKDRAEAKRQLVNAIESINDGFVIYDRDDRLIMCNEKYRQMYILEDEKIGLGCTFEEIIREGVHLGHYPEAIGREEEWISERLRLHADPRGQTEIPLSDGRWIKVSESKTLDGSTVGIRVDVTELKKALNEANAANQAKTDFINNMSHELRTPLSVVLGHVAFLKKIDMFPQYKAMKAALNGYEETLGPFQELTEFIENQAVKSERSGKHLLELINSILDWSMLSVRNVVLKKEEIDIGELLRSLGDELQDLANQKGIKLNVQVASTLIMADRLLVRQIFINLISNAIKFTEVGLVSVTMVQSQDTVKVTVHDTGIGIPEDQKEFVFERFNQVDTSTRREHGGLGLGLAITSSLVELHDGKIFVGSTLGVGSQFHVTLPRSYSPTEGKCTNEQSITDTENAAR